MTTGTHSGRALAEALNVTEGSVRTAVKATRIFREPNGLFDLEKCRARWIKSTEPSRSRVGPAVRTQAATRSTQRPLRTDAVPQPEDYVLAHVRQLPSYAALVSMSWGADLRTGYLIYRAMVLFAAGNMRRAFGDEPAVEDFEPIGLDFLQEEFKATLAPGDLARWDEEFARQWDEPEDEAA